MRPAKSKNTFGPVGIPPMGTPQTPGNKTANNCTDMLKLRNTTFFSYLRDTGSHVVRATIQNHLLFYSLSVFHISVSWWFFTGVLSNSKSHQVSRSLLCILADLNNAVVWAVSIRLVISKSYRPCNNHLLTVPRAPITIGIDRHFHVPQFFQFPCKVEVLIPLFAFFQFYSEVYRDSKVHNFASSLFFVDYYKVWSSDRD